MDLHLNDWIRIYTYFKAVALENEKTAFIKINIEELKSDLILKGFLIEQIETMMKHFVFSVQSKDLFDSFLIKYEEDVYFIPELYNFIDPSRAMISLLGGQNDKKTGIEDKGKAFENHISTLLKNGKKIKIQRNISASEREESYEIDIVFELDNILFFCECKTQSQHQDMRGYFRNRRELEIYLEKFKRNYIFLHRMKRGFKSLKKK